MGIRINKTLAFIIKTDDLHNLKKVETNIENNIYTLTGKEYLEEVKRNDPYFFNIQQIKEKDDLSGSVEILDGPFDLTESNIIMFKIPLDQSHSRYDNIIDYLECNDGLNRINYISREIFPYSGRFVSVHNLEEYTDKDLTIVRSGSKNLIKSLKKEYKEELIKKYQINFNKNLNDQFYMLAPQEIVTLAKLSGLNETEIKKLRPAILTYWL